MFKMTTTLYALAAAIAVAIPASAQVAPTTLYSFSPPGYQTRNPDGALPSGALLQATDGNFYGAAVEGGHYGMGTVFSITPFGTFSVLHTFGPGQNAGQPVCNLIEATNGVLYGTTSYPPTVFRLTLAGKFKVLHYLTSSDGSEPLAGLVQASDGDLYGTTSLARIIHDMLKVRALCV